MLLLLLALADASTIDSLKQACHIGLPGCRFKITASSADCVNMVARDKPDIVVLDSSLENSNVFEVLKQIRSFSSVPILVLSYQHDESQVVKALELGASDFLVKPVRQMEFVAYVRNLIRRNSLALDKK